MTNAMLSQDDGGVPNEVMDDGSMSTGARAVLAAAGAAAEGVPDWYPTHQVGVHDPHGMVTTWMVMEVGGAIVYVSRDGDIVPEATPVHHRVLLSQAEYEAGRWTRDGTGLPVLILPHRAEWVLVEGVLRYTRDLAAGDHRYLKERWGEGVRIAYVRVGVDGEAL